MERGESRLGNSELSNGNVGVEWNNAMAKRIHGQENHEICEVRRTGRTSCEAIVIEPVASPRTREAKRCPGYSIIEQVEGEVRASGVSTRGSPVSHTKNQGGIHGNQMSEVNISFQGEP